MRRASIVTAPGVVAAALACVAWPRPAVAYEFEVEVRSLAQGYQVRWLRFSEADRFLNRRRFTQTLRLSLWDLGAGDDPDPTRTPRADDDRFWITTSLRIDHDFGEFMTGEVDWLDGGVALSDEAVAVVPELAETRLALDVGWAYLGGRVLDGALDFQLGRQLALETLDWYAFDGLAVTWHTPTFLDVEAHAGLLVRSASQWGSPRFEPDGTSGGDCRRVEDGGGTWIAADECAQRQALMPGFGAALVTRGLPVSARLAYRRAQSPTSDAFPDGAPGWGVNEERLVLAADASFAGGGFVPYAAARWSFVHGLADEGHLGAKVGWHDHTLGAEVGWSYPSFDADSIFSVFAAEPYRDAAVSWDVWPLRGKLRGGARAFARRYQSDADDPTAWGAGGTLRWRDDDLRLVADLQHEAGYGGRKTGVDLFARFAAGRRWSFDGRVTLIDFSDEEAAAAGAAGLDGLSFGAQAGARLRLAPGAVLHLVAEENVNRFDRGQLRLLAILELGYTPEL